MGYDEFTGDDSETNRFVDDSTIEDIEELAETMGSESDTIIINWSINVKQDKPSLSYC